MKKPKSSPNPSKKLLSNPRKKPKFLHPHLPPKLSLPLSPILFLCNRKLPSLRTKLRKVLLHLPRRKRFLSKKKNRRKRQPRNTISDLLFSIKKLKKKSKCSRLLSKPIKDPFHRQKKKKLSQS